MMPEQFHEAIQEIHSKLDLGEKRMDTLQTLADDNRLAHEANAKALAENTALTREVVEILTMGKSFFKALKYIGIALKWIGSVAVALATIWALLHGTKPPEL